MVDALPHSAASLKGDSCLARSGVGFWQAFSTYKIISLFILETKFNYCALNISPHVYCIYQFIVIITLRRVFNYFCFYNITLGVEVSVHSCHNVSPGVQTQVLGLEASALTTEPSCWLMVSVV